MKIISLNIYGAYFFDPLIEFIKSASKDTDIFCLQEVLSAPKDTPELEKFHVHFFNEMAEALPNFAGYFAPAQDKDIPFAPAPVNASVGLAQFVRKKYSVQSQGDFFICNRRNSFVNRDFFTLPYNLQYVQIEINGTFVTICNVHGTASPYDKFDTPNRVAQSKKILNFMHKQKGEKIIVGDFNLMPDTKSISMIEENGFRNLIKDFSIPTTRGSLVKKMHPEYGDGPNGWQEFADYAFVSSGIKVRLFEVTDVPVSDHLPMILKFAVV